MRILVCNWRDLKHPLAGGAEVYTDAVAREWVKMGHSVTLFCAAVEGELEREVSLSGYRIVRKGSRHSVYREAKRFWKKEGKGNFDFVLDEVNTRPFFCARFIKDVRVTVLIHQVAREVWFYESPFPIAFLGRFVLEPWWLWRIRDTDIVTVSNSSRASLELYGLKNVRVVPEGYEVKEKPVVSKETDPTMVFLGRLSANKRPDHAIKAFLVVRKFLPSAKLWIIGDGPERIRLQEYAIDGVQFLGRLGDDEKIRRLASAHLLLVTSVREGWGMVVSEAAFLGVPSVGYNVDGLRDSLSAHGGALVDADPITLANAILTFFSGGLELVASDGLASKHVLSWREVSSSLLQVSSENSFS